MVAAKPIPDPGKSETRPNQEDLLFRRLFIGSPIGIYIVQDGVFQFVNPEFQKATGYSEDELIGKESLSLVISEDRDLVRQNAVRMLKGEQSSPYEFRVVNGSGEAKWIMETVTSIRYRRRPSTLGNFMDITQRKRAEEALRQSEELYRAAVEQSAEAIYLIDAETKRIIQLNPALQRLLGYTFEELKNMSIYDYLAHRREDIDHHFEHVLTEGGHFLGVRTHRRKNGSLIEMEVSANAITYNGRKVICAVARDISEYKRAEQENRFLTQQLIQVAEQQRKKLARDLHDELGQTLTALHFSLDALLNSIPEELEEQRKRCVESVSMIQQIGDTVRNISYELRPPMLDDLGVVPAFEWYIDDVVKRHGIEVDFRALGFKRRFDPDMEIVLYRVFQESLNNIIKHSRAKRVEISLTYSFPRTILTIKDDGIGFCQKSIFRGKEKKRGIGLLGMRERVASVGGSLDVRSRRRKGTIIRAELPVLRDGKDA